MVVWIPNLETIPIQASSVQTGMQTLFVEKLVSNVIISSVNRLLLGLAKAKLRNDRKHSEIPWLIHECVIAQIIYEVFKRNV